MCKVENYDEKLVYTYFFPPLTQTQWRKKVWYTLCVFLFCKKKKTRKKRANKQGKDRYKERNRKQKARIKKQHKARKKTQILKRRVQKTCERSDKCRKSVEREKEKN